MSALPQQLERVVYALCEDTDTPRALSVYLMVRYREYGQLVDLTVDPKHYDSNRVDWWRSACRMSHKKHGQLAYFLDAAVTELLRKFGDFDIQEIDKAAVALKLFGESERACYLTNRHLDRFLQNGPFEDPNEVRLFESIERMKSAIKGWLGSVPQELIGAKFGPGATFRDRGNLSTLPDKIANRPTMTHLCSSLLPLWERTAWASALMESNPGQSHPEYVRGNRFTTVPKTATKDRGIAIEASINVYYQLGVGSVVRRRLKSIGIDLENGQEVHRQVACEASRKGSYATIDLSNASDTVSYNLVKLLLPGDWFDVMDTLRSPCSQVKERWHVLQKFSSMGNGFTFELETMLFTAIVHEACFLANIVPQPGVNLFVYGDDIILPVKARATVLALLKWAGFTPNPDKTFFEGPFRESCGGDFFEGTAVRPHYLKGTPNEPAEWIALANGIRRLGRNDSEDEFCYSIYWRAWLRALDAIPSDIRRYRGPKSLGDLVIHDVRQHWLRRRSVDQQTQLKVWMPCSKALPFHHWKGPIVYACALYGVPSTGPIPRGSVSGYKAKWVSFPE